MKLKRIEVAGFKSFGKKAVLEFNSQITAVVGPNGSGKSNVAEAIRFVLGEQSMKSMRGKRGEDLIFNGSHSAGRANRGSGTIAFDNSRREFSLDFDEVSIAREVYRDGTNQYFINGSQVRLRDVFELLSAVHIGTSGHHMISQGEADHILNANPKERREMLEDALGLKIYQYKRAESERRLEKTEANMKEAEALRREIAPHLRFLKKQVEKLNEGRSLRERLIGLYREYLKREEMFVEYRKKDIEGRRSAPAGELADLNIKIAHARETLAGESASDEKSHRLLQVEKELREARLRHDELARTAGRVDGMLEHEEKQLKKKRETLVREENTPVRLGDVLTLAQTIEGELSSAEKVNDLGVVRGALSRIREVVRAFVFRHRESAGGKVLTAEDEHEVEDLRREKAKADQALEDVHEESRILETKYQEIKSEIDQEKERSRDTERALFEMLSRRRD